MQNRPQSPNHTLVCEKKIPQFHWDDTLAPSKYETESGDKLPLSKVTTST